MTGLLRSAKPWPYSVAALTIVLASLCAYGYYRHSRIKSLIEDLKSSKPEVAQAAAESLGEMGSDIVSYLTPTIKDMNSQSRFYTAVALHNFDSAVPSLVEMFKDKDVAMRVAAAEILGDMGPVAKDAVPDLIAALNDEDAGVCNMVKVALGKIKDARAIKPLIDTFKQKSKRNEAATGAAEESLAQIGSDAIPALNTALKNEAPKVKEASARTLGKMGLAAKDAVPALIEALKDEDVGVRRTVITALGEIKDPRAVEPLIETFYRDQSLDNPAPVALGKIGSEAVSPLVKNLKNEKEGIRKFSASALGEIGPAARDAVQPLIKLLKDQPVEVCTKAVWALGKIKNEEAIPPLMELLKQNPIPAGVIEALGEIGPAAKEAVPFLSNMFWDDALHSDATTAWKKISPESMNDIIYLDQRYAFLENAVKVDLLEATAEKILKRDDGSPIAYLVKFEWRLVEPKDGVNFCSTLLIDKGKDPFDGGRLGRPSPVIQARSPLDVELDYGEYHNAPPFEWGVKVIACYDSGIGCDKRGSCVGRAFISKVGRYQVVD